MNIIADDFDKPNGLCFSPDERFLYVADSGEPGHIRRLELTDTKQVKSSSVFAIIRPGIPDGFRVDKNGNIIPVDFGMMGRLDADNNRYTAEILFGFINSDYKKVAEVHFLAGLVSKEVSKDEFAQALRSIGEPIFGQSVKNISGGKLLSQLFEITEKFNMKTQIQLLLLQKTTVVVEGVARKLNPGTNI